MSAGNDGTVGQTADGGTQTAEQGDAAAEDSGDRGASTGSVDSGSDMSSDDDLDGDTSDGETSGTGVADCEDSDFGCDPCDIVVPDDVDSIATAVADAVAPARVCVRAGTYSEDVVLKPHVALSGVGVDTRIDGVLRIHELPDPDPEPTRVTDLSVVAPEYHAVSGCVDAAVECRTSDRPSHDFAQRPADLDLSRTGKR